MKECDIFNLPTFKPTQISPQNPHHQLPKVHKKKKSPKQFPNSDPRKKLTLKKGKSWTCEGQEEQCDRIRIPIAEKKKKTKKTVESSTEILMSGERRQQQRGQCEHNPAKP